MSFLQWVIGAVAGLLTLYLAARLISAAVFRSKQDYDNQRKPK